MIRDNRRTLFGIRTLMIVNNIEKTNVHAFNRIIMFTLPVILNRTIKLKVTR